MSTNRNISTLPLDALRSVTPQKKQSTQQTFNRSPATCNGQRSYRTNSIGANNLQLYTENKKLRRCLRLFLENSDLKTMNVLSSVMSMCDDKLRNFLTDKLTETHTRTTATGTSTTSDYLSSAKRIKQLNENTVLSNSYGKSFQDIDLNDLRNSTLQTSTFRSTKSSPRPEYSPALSAGSLRPPMRFGVGKSPYEKSPGKSKIGSSFHPNSQLSGGKDLPSRNKYNIRSTSRERETQADDTFGRSQLKKGVYKRPTSAPSMRLKSVFESPEFQRIKESAFSPVKTEKHCKECGVQISPTTCFCHSPWAENDTGAITIPDIGKEMPPPKYIKPARIRENETSVSNYPTAQHLLYDSVAANLDSFFDSDQSKLPTTATERSGKRHLAKSVNFTVAPQNCSIKSQYTKNVGRDENTLAEAKEAYNRGTQTSFVNNTKGSRKDRQQTAYDSERQSTGTGPNSLQCSSFQQSVSTQMPSAGSQWDDFGRVGLPQAASTPLRPTIQNRATQRQDREFNDISRGVTNNPTVGYEPSEQCECSAETTVLPYDNEEELQRYELSGNRDIGHNKTTVHKKNPEIRDTNITVEQRSPKANRISTVLLADIMGIKGRGATEKAKYIIHRPVDILTGYYPVISEEVGMILAMTKPNKRLIGEIAFQLDRRILEFVFARTNDRHCSTKRSRYYGYSVASIMLLIAKEVRHADHDPGVDLNLRMRLEYILETLQRLSYDFERHSEFTQDMVNKYGLLNGTPEPGTIEDIGLHEPAVLRVLLHQLAEDEQELEEMLIILDCLHYMAHKDKGPLFIW
ncbi:uncharacterized protein LOC123549048 [Mercenaria mercenaria]|uniref:uncharacterized protein LOC123549048 n=1 Tax=Mercenaria mercenaria TaxID=6596 RepID=UPI00234E6892|nr:uncharacterized protein LOC123549048 [Mercenaria mercenaria]